MSFTLEHGEKAPPFILAGIDGRVYELGSFSGASALIIAFMCNHCPHVTGTVTRLKELTARCTSQGVKVVAINSNETDSHPTDSFAHMLKFATEWKLNFPYLRDPSQDAARAYGAFRTPHFFLFDKEMRLAYTGRLDNSPKERDKATTRELEDALVAVHHGDRPAVKSTNPIGCTLKWWGKDEHWMPPEVCDLG